MFTFLIRTLGLWLVAGAVVAAVIDGMKTIASGGLVLTPMITTWSDLSPASFAGAKALVATYLHPAVWDTVIQWVLILPTWAVLSAFGSVLVALGSPRKRDAAYVV